MGETSREKQNTPLGFFSCLVLHRNGLSPPPPASEIKRVIGVADSYDSGNCPVHILLSKQPKTAQNPSFFHQTTITNQSNTLSPQNYTTY